MTIAWHAKLSILRVVNVIIRTMRLFIPLSSTRQFQSLPHPRLLPGRPFSIDTGTDYPEGQMDDSLPVADQSAFPTGAPFSTWISPNNFGDFHPNPLMSLFTGNGQIEYPVEAVGAVSRIPSIEASTSAISRRDTDYPSRYGSRDPRSRAASISDPDMAML